MKKLDYSSITSSLFVGRTPYRAVRYEQLEKLGVSLVINMRADMPSMFVHKHSSIREIWVPTIDNRFVPFNQDRLYKAAEKAAREIKAGGKVYVYCRKGRHRSVLMVACILILLGYSVEHAVSEISTRRPVADLSSLQVKRALIEFYCRHGGDSV